VRKGDATQTRLLPRIRCQELDSLLDQRSTARTPHKAYRHRTAVGKPSDYTTQRERRGLPQISQLGSHPKPTQNRSCPAWEESHFQRWRRQSVSRFPMLPISDAADVPRIRGIGDRWRNWLACALTHLPTQERSAIFLQRRVARPSFGNRRSAERSSAKHLVTMRKKFL